mgnify:CR=1 FL=1
MTTLLKSLLVACVVSAVGSSAVVAQSRIYDHSKPMFFTNQAMRVGVESPGFGRGTAMVDLDNDGLLDLIVTTAGGDDQFWRQTSSQNFEQMNIPWSVPATQDESWGVLVADFDNDGDKDVYFPNGGYSPGEANVMLRNDLNTSGKFENISASSGACASALSNFGGSVLDYDNDGDLDIFLTTAVSYWATTPQRCELYRNDGLNPTTGVVQFEEVGLAAGITMLGDFRNCGVADYDNDGYMDIMVGSYDGNNLLYHNNGDGTFTDKAQAAGVQDPFRSFGGTFEDFNNDGWPDIFTGNDFFEKDNFYLNNK